jgi:glutamate transport system substrate-binding protein
MSFRKLAAVLLAGGLALTACGQQSNLGSSAPSAPPVASGASFPEGSTMAKLAAAGTIRVGTKFDQPLFGLKGLDGKPAGFDVEIGKLIAGELGIPADKIEWIEAPSKVREEVIEQGKVDLVIATYTINDTRKQRVDFAGPYYVAGQQILTRKGDSSITGPDSFRDGTKKVCSVTGSTPLATIQNKYKSAIAVPFATYTECVQQLLNGSVDAVTTDGAILLGYAARQPTQLKVVGDPFSKERYGIGVKKDDTAFRAFINDALQKSIESGDWKKAYDSTLGKSGTPAPAPPTIDRY